MIYDKHPTDGIVIRELRDALSDLAVRRPPLEAIVDRGRRHRRRQRGRLAGLSVVALVACAALLLGLTGVHGRASRSVTSKQSATANPGTIRTVAFTLVSFADGTAKLTLTNTQVFDPPELQRALARAGIPALVKSNVYCSSDPAPPDPNEIGVLSTKLPPGFPRAKGLFKPQMAHTPRVDRRPLVNHTVTVINRQKMPAGTELAFDYAPGKHLLAVNLVYTNAHTCRSGLPPAH